MQAQNIERTDEVARDRPSFPPPARKYVFRSGVYMRLSESFLLINSTGDSVITSEQVCMSEEVATGGHSRSEPASAGSVSLIPWRIFWVRRRAWYQFFKPALLRK